MRAFACLLLTLTLLLVACGDGATDDEEAVATASKDDSVGDVVVGGDDADEQTPAATPTGGPSPSASSAEPTSPAGTTETPPTEVTATPEAPEPSGPPTEGLPGGRYVTIDAIRAEGQSYAVDFTAYNFTPLIAEGPEDFHVHFFWDTLEPQNAGTNGPNPGSWALYDGPSPFTQFAFSDRPPAATSMCALVADSAHGVTLESGNCVTLP